MAKDYYGILGVHRKASDQDLKRAYRKLARELHPDVNPDPVAQEKFREITVAYEVLSDPARRQIVDSGGDPMASSGMGSGFGFTGGLGDIFEAFFGGGMGASRSRGPRGRVQPGADAKTRVRITLEECATGVTKEIVVDTAILCSSCQGSGSASKAQPVTCQTCGGQGEIQQIQRSLLGQVMTTQVCRDCQGAGVCVVDPCSQCEGEGRVLARRTISASIPAGVSTGNQIRLAGQGEVGRGGGAAGDLYVEIVELEHPIFVRDGVKLHVAVKVPMVDAALGAAFSLRTILGEDIEIDIPAGSQTGSTVVVKGHGMPHVNSGHRGDLEIHIDVQIPKKLDPEHVRLLTAFKDARDDQIIVEGEHKHASANGSGIFSRLRHTFSAR